MKDLEGLRRADEKSPQEQSPVGQISFCPGPRPGNRNPGSKSPVIAVDSKKANSLAGLFAQVEDG
jgi:hypothetical protein